MQIASALFSGPKKQPKHKVLGQDIPGTSRTKTLCKNPFSVVLDTEWPGCPGIWVGTSRIWKNFMQENFGLIFRTHARLTLNDANHKAHWLQNPGLGALCRMAISRDSLQNGPSPCVAWSQGVANRGSQMSAPLALSEKLVDVSDLLFHVRGLDVATLNR